MGICASCLGLKKDEDEWSRLITNDEPNYGSNYNNNTYYANHINEQNEHQREREQLEQIVTQTNDNLIDIFHMHTTPVGYGENSRAETYRLLLQKTSPPPPPQLPEILPMECITHEERELLERVGKMAEEAVASFKTIKGVGCLVVNMNVDA